jgi:arylformamidase
MAESGTANGAGDRDRLNADLNVCARWPEHAAFFSRWHRDSQVARTRTRVMQDLGYGRWRGERMDVFPVAGARAAPVVVFLHGGAWQSRDKSDVAFLAPPLVARGIGFVAVNYDLAPRVRIRHMVHQVRRAVSVLHAQGTRWGFDPQRIFVAGHEAGGHLAANALNPNSPVDSGLPPGAVAGGLSLSGIYDLDPIRLSYQQATLDLTEDDVQALSPARNLPESAGPLLLAVGAAETDTFRHQQAAFLAAWQDAGLRGRGMELPGRHHFDALDALAEPEHPLFQALVNLVAHNSIV